MNIKQQPVRFYVKHMDVLLFYKFTVLVNEKFQFVLYINDLK